jgi:hypothetical protein
MLEGTFDWAGLSGLTWIGIVLCVSQSAMFSGLNLAYFSVSRLRLEIEAATGDRDAQKVLALRQDPSFLLTTILWGNVGINVLLTLLSNSVMAGVSAFLFSTVVITFFGEIAPQAYFSRNALKMGALMCPALRFYQFLLYPVAKPVALVLDKWLGAEGPQYLREHDMRELIRKHIAAEEADVDRLEGMGALNFLSIDDLPAGSEGELLDPKSVVSLPVENDLPVFPQFERVPNDPFITKIQASGRKWVILTDHEGTPRLVCDSDGFLRAALLGQNEFDPYSFCHRPILVRDGDTPLGHVIARFRVYPERSGDDVIDDDVILLWTDEKRVITGADILGRLLRGIAESAVRPDLSYVVGRR